ncbi:hypothetical protein E0Z10_g3589 [Xylaria hypoxylon]|uniref:Heterokaryon incompatibility domain-containing protein n=1 Tax=Xylaria hypoxylon TaxID=37992 RepID=A0A4Z0Z371_9PEZI|nr:hypothetical protein E0Z10_g3589 [Xylaria hypoxylon]
MRLLRAADLQFEEFEGDNIPKYAILSHRWEQDEVSYRDVFKATKTGEIPSSHPIRDKQGFQKIHSFSQQALKEDFEYIWVDTCCINKDSSAELQEAINSMFRWYEESEACFAYLSDVFISPDDMDSPSSHDEPDWVRSFKESQWFTRGWTLQELLAPRQLIFFDRNWNTCGSVGELHPEIYEATGIKMEALNHPSSRSKEVAIIRRLDVARRMSWAANRNTTRIEDRAYSLLGLFDIHMPLLYGEGKRSFQRLQEEILQVDDDLSILAWSCTDADTDFAPNGLARWLTNFQKYIKLFDENMLRFSRHSLTVTQRGLQATLQIRRDPNKKVLAYIALAEGTRRFDLKKQYLVLPIMVLQKSSWKSRMKNDCVRFSDPLWVTPSFLEGLEGADLEPLCFVRHFEADELRPFGEGLSLSTTVWRDYIPTFTYPVQAQLGRRHFPAILGNFMFDPGTSHKRVGGCVLVIELESRTKPSQRYVVLVEGVFVGAHGLQSSLTVVVAQIPEALNLEYALSLVKHESARQKLVPCGLHDRTGQVIPENEIVQFQYFGSYWVHRPGGDSAELLPRFDPPEEPANNTANCIVS